MGGGKNEIKGRKYYHRKKKSLRACGGMGRSPHLEPGVVLERDGGGVRRRSGCGVGSNSGGRNMMRAGPQGGGQELGHLVVGDGGFYWVPSNFFEVMNQEMKIKETRVLKF